MSDSSGSETAVTATAAGIYVTPTELAKQLAYRDITDARLQRVCDAAAHAIDDWCGRTEPWLAPVPAGIQEIALSLAVDMWKQPDATFGIMGLSETGPVRVARDLVARYDASLIKFYDPLNGWGVA
jgi:hypothetical protein